MAKLPLVHCRICKGSIDREKEKEDVDWIMPSKNFFYHCSCYNDWAKKEKRCSFRSRRRYVEGRSLAIS